MEDYQLVEEVEADGGIPVSHFINRKTGIKIFLAYVETPIVKGEMAFATEVHDDDGLPHTLEHLVFLGSEDIPFKGVLDLMASRSFADGTNAFTDTDFTAYTLRTAGAEGFLNILPVYMDHLFFPTLTDQGYTTEVHHINGRGEDAGVVYCEMQARQNTGESRCMVELCRALYPGKCGYKSVTGGLMENIRESLDNTKVRNYHAQYYVPSNFCIVITGPIKPEELFNAIKPVEEKLWERFGNKTAIERPWSSEVPDLEKSVIKKIQYSSDSKEDGLVYLAYRGPNCVDNFKENIAITVLTEYLNQPSVSPFQRVFVESENPICSNIDAGVMENRVSFFFFAFEAVDVESLDKVKEKVDEILNRIVNQEDEFEIERMKVIIKKRMVSILLSAERNPYDIVECASISHFLYGNDGMKDRFQILKTLEEYTLKDKIFWIDLIKKYMIGPDARSVCINAEPSPELLESMTNDEKKRIQEQKEFLGQNLASLEEKLELARAYNDRPVPTELLYTIPIPSIDKITFHKIETNTLETSELPITVRYDLIKTNFVSVYVAINTSNRLKPDERLYIPLMQQLLFESPIVRNGKLIDHQHIVRELYADTISANISSGVAGTVINMILLNLHVEKKNYDKAVNWMKQILFDTKFTTERIKTISTRMIGDISQTKRDGDSLVKAALDCDLYKPNCNKAAEILFRQQVFLKKLLKDLKTSPESVEAELERIRNLLVNEPQNIYGHVALDRKDFATSELILKPWYAFLPEQYKKCNWDEKRFNTSTIEPTYELINLDKEGIDGVLISNGSVESNYFRQIIPSIRDPYHDDVAPLLVLIQYFTQLEGSLWKEIRGAGLAYNYNLYLGTSAGVLTLIIDISNQLIDAYKKTKEVIIGQLNNSQDFERHLFESAKSSLIYDFINREKNPSSKSMQSLVAFLRQIDADFERKMLYKIANVKLDDLKGVGQRYLTDLFEGKTRKISVCCHPANVPKLNKDFHDLGCELKPCSVDSADLINFPGLA